MLLAAFQKAMGADTELGELYMGEFEEGRHFWFVANSTGTEDIVLGDFFDAMFARCRDRYGGRLAWLDTPVRLVRNLASEAIG